MEEQGIDEGTISLHDQEASASSHILRQKESGDKISSIYNRFKNYPFMYCILTYAI
jgi:hypothetical protein